MSTEKMREEFESAWRLRYPDHEEIAFKRSYIEPQSYVASRVRDAWWAWQASRGALSAQFEAKKLEVSDEHEDWPERECWNNGVTACQCIVEQGPEAEVKR